jgi:pimeloyl-ACP methyl ester carboxylesterase
VVVFDAGLGNDGTVWDRVQRDVAMLTEGCVYDRAGLGASGRAPRPHPNRQMAHELRELLSRSNHRGPYVLVGHSMGGVNVRLLASEHPDDVAGMVLVDAMTEDQPSRYWALIPRGPMSEFRAGLNQLPEGIDFDTLVAGIGELRRASTTLGDKPLVVLTRGKEPAAPWASPELTSKLLAAWHETQASLPRLSTNSVHVVARNGHHALQDEAPRLVGAAIREVVQASRARTRLDPAKLSTLADEVPPR